MRFSKAILDAAAPARERQTSTQRRAVTLAAIERFRDRGITLRTADEINVDRLRNVLEVPSAERERRIDDIAEELLRACEGPDGKLKPWRPFDVHALAHELFRIATAGKKR